MVPLIQDIAQTSLDFVVIVVCIEGVLYALDHYEGWICKIRGHHQPFECTRIKEGMAPGDPLVFEKTGKVVCDTCGLLLK